MLRKQQQQQQQRQWKTGSGGGGRSVRDWLTVLGRRAAVACRPRVIVRFLGALLVAGLLILLVTKGLGQRRRAGSCSCTKFTYSQCQPNDRACGQGVKKAFCQQKRCLPRRKLVRCSVPCADEARVPDGAGGVGGGGPCIYSVRRQSIWSRCTEGAKHRSRILFLQAAVSQPDCPPTKTERRSCRASKPLLGRKCIYEPSGSWSACDRDRNAIVNTRKLIDGTVNNCPPELKTTLRCLKRDGTLKCIYSNWTKWSKCDGGTRHKTRSLIQGRECDQVTRLVQNCVPQ